ncbi:hypothetical protein [uncultured Nocardioides sp.]|uniref:hypothetical protein n=1 Tax=uncultured Nocardioides sp. TaxID=198441 RepID=UPI002616C73A|nr:hypothetical protein [uncultured Nocardioides sp.]
MSTPQRTAETSPIGALETGKVRGFTTQSFNRAVGTVFDAAERVAATSGHQVREVDRGEHTITVTSRDDAGTPAWSHELGVADDETGGSRLLVLTTADQADTTRAERRAGRRTARR